MSKKEILIGVTVRDQATGRLRTVKVNVEQLGKSIKKFGKESSTSVKQTTTSFAELGPQLRYLSLVTGVATAALINMTKGFVDAAAQAQNAQLKLNAFAQITNQSGESANNAAQNFVLANNGLISLTESATILANLMASGMNIQDATKLMQQMLDTAVLQKESLEDTFGEAMIKSSLGLRILQERQIDAIGVNFRADQVIRDYAKSLNTTSAALSTAQKQQALINHVMQETAKFAGGASVAASTFSGHVSGMSASLNMMQQALGRSLMPLLGSFADLIKKAAVEVRTFADNHSELTMIILVGTTALMSMLTVLASAGALFQMLKRGIQAMLVEMIGLTLTAPQLTLLLVSLSFAIGAITALVLKATGKWDEWRQNINNLGNTVKNAINPMQQFGDAVEEVDEKLAKQVKTLEESIGLATRDFKETMAEWVQTHDEKIADMKENISDLTATYSKETDKIKKKFNDTMRDMNVSHRRKTEDLIEQINEETSKGIWADQTRIRELKKELKRENEDYAASVEEKQQMRDEDLTTKQSEYSSDLAELQTKLEAEVALEEKHSKLIAEARTWPILDAIEKIERTYTEKLDNIKDQLNDLSDQATNTTNIISSAFDSLSDTLTYTINKYANLGITAYNSATLARNSWLFASDAIVTVENDVKHLGVAIDNLNTQSLAQQTTGNIQRIIGPNLGIPQSSLNQSNFNNFTNWGLPSYDDGGVVTGPVGSPQLAVVHGGEQVVPTDSSPVTININNPIVRNDADIKEIARQVDMVLSRQTLLKRHK